MADEYGIAVIADRRFKEKQGKPTFIFKFVADGPEKAAALQEQWLEGFRQNKWPVTSSADELQDDEDDEEEEDDSIDQSGLQ